MILWFADALVDLLNSIFWQWIDDFLHLRWILFGASYEYPKLSQETHSGVSDIGVGVLDDNLLQLFFDMLEDWQQLLALLDLSAVAEKMFDNDDLNTVKD